MTKFVIITAPSGAGKTSILNGVLKHLDLGFCVSATNRPMREGEVHGKHYYFYSTEAFKQMIEQDALLEWEEVYPGRFYGTPFSEIERLQSVGKPIVFDLEVKGAKRLKSKFPDSTLAIFIKPPSLEVLIDRLEKRKTETPESFKVRVDRMRMELAQMDSFDTHVLNDDLEVAIQDTINLIKDFIEA